MTTLKTAVRKLRKAAPWPQFGVPSGHEATARDAYNAAITDVLDVLDHATLAPIEPPHDLPPPHAADELRRNSSE